MKICKIIIKGFQQFQDTELDFTHPVTGNPLNKICLIGQNGTGKSTILRLINQFLVSRHIPTNSQAIIILQLHTQDELVYRIFPPRLGGSSVDICVAADIDNADPNWIEKYQKHLADIDINKVQHIPNYSYEFFGKDSPYFAFYRNGPEKQSIDNEIGQRSQHANKQNGLIIYSPAEAGQNTYYGVGNVPQTSLNDAIQLMNEFPLRHEVSKATVSEMWKMLVHLVKQQESDQQSFELRPENLEKTKRELIDEFSKRNPDILSKLGELWNSILDRANLEFDVAGAKRPVQLSENLEAYIRLKRNGHQRISYNQLSTGIRDFLFRIGHIYLLFYRREIRQAFLMVDEPENSLFPDFLFDLMELYQEIANPPESPDRTQMFFATHNPIVAAQFEPYERIILEWQEDGYVKAHKGKAPAGDDPNDVLRQDFELTSLMGKRGKEKWNEYLQLKKQARHEKDPGKQTELINAALKIGSEYNFPAGNNPSRI